MRLHRLSGDVHTILADPRGVDRESGGVVVLFLISSSRMWCGVASWSGRGAIVGLWLGW